jgi:hypothetical protein
MPKKTAKATRTSRSGRASRPTTKGGTGRRWSRKVNETSNALDLRSGVFKLGDPHQMAVSLKRSAEESKRRKGSPYQSAMSMLNFYLNRAGRQLGVRERARVERAKVELRGLFGR